MFVADLDPRFAKIPGKADQIDPARRSMDSGLPLYDAAPSKLVNLDGELRYVMTIGVATIMNVQGHTDTIKNTKLDAAYRLDQAKMAETQFTYLQTTSLVDRRHPRRIKLADVDIQTTEEMKGQHFEAKTNCSELEAQYQGLPDEPGGWIQTPESETILGGPQDPGHLGPEEDDGTQEGYNHEQQK